MSNIHQASANKECYSLSVLIIQNIRGRYIDIFDKCDSFLLQYFFPQGVYLSLFSVYKMTYAKASKNECEYCDS